MIKTIEFLGEQFVRLQDYEKLRVLIDDIKRVRSNRLNDVIDRDEVTDELLEKFDEEGKR